MVITLPVGLVGAASWRVRMAFQGRHVGGRSPCPSRPLSTLYTSFIVGSSLTNDLTPVGQGARVPSTDIYYTIFSVGISLTSVIDVCGASRDKSAVNYRFIFVCPAGGGGQSNSSEFFVSLARLAFLCGTPSERAHRRLVYRMFVPCFGTLDG